MLCFKTLYCARKFVTRFVVFIVRPAHLVFNQIYKSILLEKIYRKNCFDSMNIIYYPE